MVSKKILGVAIAAAMSVPAFAAIDMTGGTNGAGAGALLIAKESVLTTQLGSAAPLDTTMLQVTAAANNLDVIADLGFGVSAGSHAFVRFDLTNAKFKTLVGDTQLTLPGQTVTTDYVVTVAQGGAIGDTYVIFDVTAVNAQVQTQDVQLALASLQVSTSSPVTISYAHYSTSPNAVAKTGSLASDSYEAISVANVLTTTIAATDRVASVSADPAFSQFVTPGSATAVIGNVKFKLASGAIDAVGAGVVTLAGVMDVGAAKSKLEVAGDLSFTVADTAINTAKNLTFNGVFSNTAATNVPSAKLDNLGAAVFAIGSAANAGNDVAITATSAMNAGAYTLTFTPTKLANAAFPPAAVAGALGSISRSGTTVQVPYMTTFADYNQRLILVNRGASAVPYNISFTKEAGVTATAGTAATGTLAAMETKVIKVTDIVTITGSTRTAATVVVTAPTTTIDAAITQVNLSDKSTDTVKLN